MKGLRSAAASGSVRSAVRQTATSSPSFSPSTISVSSPLAEPAVTYRGTSVVPCFTHSSRLPGSASAAASARRPSAASSSPSGTNRRA